MKEPPSQVAPPQCRFLPRRAKDNHLCPNDKCFHACDDRPERTLPFHAPHGLHSEEELLDWITHEMEGGQP